MRVVGCHDATGGTHATVSQSWSVGNMVAEVGLEVRCIHDRTYKAVQATPCTPESVLGSILPRGATRDVYEVQYL